MTSSPQRTRNQSPTPPAPVAAMPPLPPRGIIPSFATHGVASVSFDRYCNTFPDAGKACSPRDPILHAPEALTPERWRDLVTVNRDVNGNGDPARKIQYPKPVRHLDPATGKTTELFDDAAIYGAATIDLYANTLSPHFKGKRENGVPLGDCDDYAITKQHLLIHTYGFAPENVLIAEISTSGRNEITHAVVVVLTDRGMLVLDNDFGVVKRWEDTDYYFTRIQSRTDPRTFVPVTAAIMLDTTHSGTNILSTTITHENMRSTMHHYHINDPRSVTILSEGWQCTAKEPLNLIHWRYPGVAQLSLFNRALTTETMRVTHHPDATNPTHSAYEPTPQHEHPPAAVTVPRSSQNAPLPPERITHITQSLRDAGIACEPTPDKDDDHYTSPLPSLHLLRSLADYQLR